MNPSARDMLGLAAKYLIGKNVRDILSPPRYAEVLKNIDWGMKNRHKLADKEIAVSSDGQEHASGPGPFAAETDRRRILRADRRPRRSDPAHQGPEDRGLEGSRPEGRPRDQEPPDADPALGREDHQEPREVRARPPGRHRGGGPDDHPRSGDDQVAGRRVLQLRPDAQSPAPGRRHPGQIIDQTIDLVQGHFRRDRIRGRIRAGRALDPGRSRTR